MILAIAVEVQVALVTAGGATAATLLELARRGLRNTRQINLAVNNVDNDEPPLVERIHRIELRQVAHEAMTRATRDDVAEIRDDIRMITNKLIGDKP